MSTNNSESERQLIIGLINGEEEAFCELYTLYKERLIYFALKFIKSKEYAEDLYQEAFTAVWQNRKFINPDSPFAPYIYTIIKNRILNLIAEINKDRHLKDSIVSKVLDYDNDTEDTLIYKDLNNLLDKALQELTPQQRRVFDMSRLNMMSHKEIASELNISVYTVQQHISSSLKTIKNYLRKYGSTYTNVFLALLLISNFC